MPKRKTVVLKMRIRLYIGDRLLGPGKMELLAHIAASGSLSAAAKQMRMSYMRAWKLVQDLNSNSERQLVAMSRGGAGGGTGKLTPLGTKVLALYQKMEGQSTKAATPFGKKIAVLLE
ncbi:MAG: LysR family transcriptional regulator [Verrucomicrobiota bacterium]|nr:LysR family transcriptional regulator [Verrucomicrobiota bacterium]